MASVLEWPGTGDGSSGALVRVGGDEAGVRDPGPAARGVHGPGPVSSTLADGGGRRLRGGRWEGQLGGAPGRRRGFAICCCRCLSSSVEAASPWPSMEVRGGRPSLPRRGSVHVTAAYDQRSLAGDKEAETLAVGGWRVAAVGCARRIWSEGKMERR